MTQKEILILADIRNLMSPILNYFQLRTILETEEVDKETQNQLELYISQDERNCFENLPKIKKLLDSLG